MSQKLMNAMGVRRVFGVTAGEFGGLLGEKEC